MLKPFTCRLRIVNGEVVCPARGADMLLGRQDGVRTFGF